MIMNTNKRRGWILSNERRAECETVEELNRKLSIATLGRVGRVGFDEIIAI